MNQDLVIGIDSSTTATKATAWDRDGTLVAEARQSIPMTNPLPGHFEQNPEDWWRSTADSLKALSQEIDSNRVATLSISNQRETLGLFDEYGAPIRQGIVWLDERGIEECEALSAKVGAERLHAISGKAVDVVVPIYKMMWLRGRTPEVFAKATHYADVHCYLSHRLTGQWTTSRASADPSGMLDMEAGLWSDELLEAASVPASMMPGLAIPGNQIGTLSAEAAAETGLPEGTPLIAGGGDGQCAATGAGAIQAGTAYMNLGTAVVSGVYSQTYGHDLAFRTETAVSETGYIFETVLKSGTFLIDWFQREFGGGTSLIELEQEAASSPIGAGGITVLPFWQGSMTPHWDAKARGVIAGLSGSSHRGDVYRALLEGLALDQAYSLEKTMGITNARIDRINAIGGGAASQLMLQIVADAMNVPVHRAEVTEASALGAAMCAAKGAGWYASIPDAAAAMQQQTMTVTSPIPENVARYRELRAIYDDLWPTLSAWNSRMWDFANS